MFVQFVNVCQNLFERDVYIHLCFLYAHLEIFLASVLAVIFLFLIYTILLAQEVKKIHEASLKSTVFY